MHGKIKNILKKTALLLTLGLTCITAMSIGRPQNVQAASHIYRIRRFTYMQNMQCQFILIIVMTRLMEANS